MNFGYALEEAKRGAKISRKGWNGKGQYVMVGYVANIMLANANFITEGIHSDIKNKCLVFFGTRGMQVGWLATQADMLAEDWEIIKEI